MHWRHVYITTTPCWGSRLVALRARVVLEERWRSQPLSQCAGPGRPGGMACRGWPIGCMLWRWRTWQCLVWPPTRGGALLWRHMHKVYRQSSMYCGLFWPESLSLIHCWFCPTGVMLSGPGRDANHKVARTTARTAEYVPLTTVATHNASARRNSMVYAVSTVETRYVMKFVSTATPASKLVSNVHQCSLLFEIEGFQSREYFCGSVTPTLFTQKLIPAHFTLLPCVFSCCLMRFHKSGCDGLIKGTWYLTKILGT